MYSASVRVNGALRMLLGRPDENSTREVQDLLGQSKLMRAAHPTLRHKWGVAWGKVWNDSRPGEIAPGRYY